MAISWGNMFIFKFWFSLHDYVQDAKAQGSPKDPGVIPRELFLSLKYTVGFRILYTLQFFIYILVCTAQTTKSMQTNDIPLKSPIKVQEEMQKKFWIFQNLLDF